MTIDVVYTVVDGDSGNAIPGIDIETITNGCSVYNGDSESGTTDYSGEYAQSYTDVPFGCHGYSVHITVPAQSGYGNKKTDLQLFYGNNGGTVNKQITLYSTSHGPPNVGISNALGNIGSSLSSIGNTLQTDFEFILLFASIIGIIGLVIWLKMQFSDNGLKPEL